MRCPKICVSPEVDDNSYSARLHLVVLSGWRGRTGGDETTPIILHGEGERVGSEVRMPRPRRSKENSVAFIHNNTR